MENLYDKILLMKKQKLAPQQALIESNINIDGQDEVEKILAINTNVDLDGNIEAVSGECMVNGKIITNLVFSTTTGELNSQSSISPFAYKLTSEEISSGAKLNVVASVVNTEMDKIQANQLKVINTINIDAVVLKNDEMEYLKDSKEDTFIKQEEKEIISLKGVNCDKFEEKLEATVKNGVKKILMTNVDCVLREWSTGPNFISVECELYAKVLYADNQEVSELQTITISKNIKQELEAEGVDKDCDLELLTCIINEHIMVEVEEGENETKILINVPLLVCYNKYESTKILTISDIYSSTEVLSVQKEDGSYCRNLKPEYFEEKIEGNVVLGDDQPRIDKYLATTNVTLNVSNSYIKNNVLYIEGIASANVVYLNDELGTLQSVQIEIPYILDKNVEAGDNVITQPIVSLFDIDVMVKRGREIYFDAKAKVFVNLTCENELLFVSNVTGIGELSERSGAIEIYFGKAGESVWDIAKSLKISSEIIMEQNPELVDPLDKDQNIALYFQKIK